MPLFLFLVALAAFAPASFAAEGVIIERDEAPENSKIAVIKRTFTDTEIKILQELEERRIELDRLNQVLVIRERLVDLAEGRMIDRITELKRLHQELIEILNNLSEKEEKHLQELAIVYSEMKPKLAAQRLNALDNMTVFETLKRMKHKKAAKVMEKMDIEKVRVISEMLAEKSLLPLLKTQQLP